MMAMNVTPQGGIPMDSIMVASVTDASISLYQTVLRQGLEKCQISGNASVVQAAYRISKIQEAIKHAAIDTLINNRLLKHIMQLHLSLLEKCLFLLNCEFNCYY
jgi:hypothetical protein